MYLQMSLGARLDADVLRLFNGTNSMLSAPVHGGHSSSFLLSITLVKLLELLAEIIFVSLLKLSSI